MNAAIIICSRQESRRLPGKVFKKIAGVPAIEHLLGRVAGQGIPVFVAVPAAEREAYAHLASFGVNIVTGDAESPLHRTADVARVINPKWIVRVTHDDILIDIETVKALIDQCEFEDAGYGVAPGIVDGAGAEVIRTENLLYAAKQRAEATEFISYFVKGYGLPYPGTVRMKTRPTIMRPYRLTMDYPEDALVLEVVLRACGRDASVDDICKYLDKHSHVLRLNRQPLLSVYTCAYNAGPWIGQTIESVLANDMVGEYVIVDDYSTDATLEIVARYSNDPRLKIVTTDENRGLASCSNLALSRTRGRYVMRVDADDLLINCPTLLCKMMDLLGDGYRVVYPGYLEINGDTFDMGELKDPRTHHHAGGAMFEKRFLDEMRFKESLRNWDGLELYTRISKAGGGIGYIGEPTWFYRKRPDSMSAVSTEQRARDRAEIGG